MTPTELESWASLHQWLLTGHIVGVLLWIGCMTAVFWVLRMHTQMPETVNDKFILMERSLALAMDIVSALAIGTGIALIVHRPVAKSIFSEPGAGWFHIKAAVVVLGILSMHGMLRARVAKFSRGEKPTVPTWIWSVILVSVVAIVVLVFRGPIMFAPKP